MHRALLAILLLAAPAALSAKTVVAPSEIPVQWIRAGESHEMMVHKIGKQSYVTVEHLAKLSESQLRWLPASKRACLTNTNGTLCFDWETHQAALDDRRLRGSVGFLFDQDRLLIPLPFVLSSDFERFSATQISWNPQSNQLKQDLEVNLRLPQVERTNGVYRLVLDVNPSAPPQLIDKSENQIWLRFTRAITAGSQILEGDSVISEVRITQRRKTADLILKLGEDARESEVYFEDGKRRLIVAITPSEQAMSMIANSIEKTQTRPMEVTTVKKGRAARRIEKPKKKNLVIPTRESPAAEIKVAASTVKTATLKTPALPSRKAGVRTYVIDAGHGGIDCGAIGVRGTREKDINLAVARSLARELRKQKGVRVIMTREKDEFIPLQQRTEIANRAGADLFISVHCNSSLSSKGNGFEAYFLSVDATDKAAEGVARMENSVVSLEVHKGNNSSKLGQLLASMAVYDFINESSKFASIMARKMKEKANVDRSSVKEADFHVLRGAQMPSLLLELEYVSNPISEIKLRSSRYQNQLVKGIVEGVLAYDKQQRREQEAYALQMKRDPVQTER